MTPTLYLTRNGLLEPLVKSQVLAYLRGLSQQHRITLITYAKDADWADVPRVAALREQCERLQMRWLPQRFWPSPKLVVPALSMVRMVSLSARGVRQQRAGLIHARYYILAAVALLVGRITGVPFIYVSANVSAASHRRHTLGSWALIPVYLFWTFRKSFLVILSGPNYSCLNPCNGFGNVINEALEVGMSVVSTDCLSGPREILSDGRFGRLIPVGDSGALAEAMAASLAATHDTQALKARAQDFSIDKAVDQYEALLFPNHSPRAAA